MFPSRRLALSLLPCAMLLQACASSSIPVVVRPQPGAELLAGCVDPQLAPDNASDSDIALERLAVAEAYVDCKRRHADLAQWVRGQ